MFDIKAIRENPDAFDQGLRRRGLDPRSADLIALDAKINLDSNALYRHKDLLAMRDISQEDPREAAAAEHDLNYITLDGNIGCMVNGAGLAMATMDMTKLFGGSPANFLDIGGGAQADKVAAALRIILADPNVKAILFNIFGGITRCDDIAKGILIARDQIDLSVPLVIRLIGTNEKEGRVLLEQAGLEAASAMTEAVKKVLEKAKAGV